MIYVDIMEQKRVKDRCIELLGEQNCSVKKLGSYDCKDLLIPLKKGSSEVCANEEQAPSLTTIGYTLCRNLCTECKDCKYVQFADFEIGEGRAFYERKTARDFVDSRKDRLYEQMKKIDTFVQGRKGLILEGMPLKVVEDSVFNKARDKVKTHNMMSPLRQAIEIGKNKNWTLSFIRELKAHDMEFVQTWDLDETIEFLRQCDLGYDNQPKYRIIPKRYPELPIERNILIQFSGIGKVRSEQILNEYKDINNLITKLVKKVDSLGYDRKKQGEK